jgi:hypothetical protein
MSQPWSHLPNAVHIDRILAHAKQNPGAWDAARNAVWSAAWNAAWSAARNAVWSAISLPAWSAAWRAARNAVCNAISLPAWNAAWDAITSLIAWDNSSELLDMPADQVYTWAALGNPAARLMYPAVLVFAQKEYSDAQSTSLEMLDDKQTV